MQSSGAAVLLKIRLVKLNQDKSMKFANDSPIWEILKEIQEKQGGEGGQDHGLFQPPSPGKKGRWLKPNHTLKYYDVQSGVRI
jgi:hypothetical protein